MARTTDRDDRPEARQLATTRPWEWLDMSRSTWYELLDRGIAPPAIQLPAGKRFWRVADLEKWLAAFKADGGRWRSRARREESDGGQE